MYQSSIFFKSFKIFLTRTLIVVSIFASALYAGVKVYAVYYPTDNITNPACAPGAVGCYVSLLPDQTSNAGKFLITNGVNPSWGNIITSATSSDSSIAINTASVDYDSYLSLQEAGIEKWKFRNQGDSNDKLRIGSAANATALSIMQNGHISINSVVDSAWLYLPAGSTVGQTAPLKFTSGPLMTNPEPGAVEYLNNQLYLRGSDGLSVAGNVGIGNTNPGQSLDIYGSAARMWIEHNSASGGIWGARNIGTRTSPLPYSSGFQGGLEFSLAGWNGTNYYINRNASVRLINSEAWTSTANGAEIWFNTGANGTTSSVTRSMIKNSGEFVTGYFGSPSSFTPGATMHVIALSTSVVSGTTTANASTTITGSGTTFTTSLSVGDRISLSSASSTYATVTAITDNTTLTVDAALGNGTSQTINLKRGILRADDNSGTKRLFINDIGRTTIDTGPGDLAEGLVLDQTGNTNSGRLFFMAGGSPGYTMYYHGAVGGLVFRSGGVPGSTSGSGRISFSNNGQITITGNSGNSVGTGLLNIGGAFSQTAWGTTGVAVSSVAATYTNSSTLSGTVATAVFNSFGIPVLAATNPSITTTDVANVYIAGAPTAGTNQTITNSYALWSAGGKVRIDGVAASAVSDSTVCISTTGVITKSSAACTASSSIRFKTDVMDYTNSLSKVNALRPVSFTYTEGGKHDIGFIAEEVNQIEPKLVLYEDDGITPKGLFYDRFTVLLAGAVKELDLKVNQLSSLDVSNTSSLGSLIEKFLGDVLNPVKNIFVKKIQVEQICIDESNCLTKEDLKILIQNARANQVSQPVVENPVDNTPDNSGTPAEIPTE